MRKPFNIFHTKVDFIDFDTAMENAKRYLTSEKTHTIVTPNPEILLKAEKDHELRDAINNADLRLPDGGGLLFAGRFLGTPFKERVPGVDFVTALLLYAERHHHSVHVVLLQEGLTHTREVRRFFEHRMPKLNYTCQEVSKQYFLSGHILGDIAERAPDILLVTSGAPSQEKWLFANKHKLKNVSIAMGIGGSFDMLTGTIPRAPKLLRKARLEWLWRLVVQPEQRVKRFKRILNAVVVFWFKVMILKFRTLFVYRNNVLGFVYKDKENIFVLHKRGYKDGTRKRSGHWALPQGGVDGNEPLANAVKREVKEETGMTNMTSIVRAYAKNKYDWVPYYRNIYSHRYAGQKQQAFFLKFIGDDDEIRLNFIGDENFDAYRWVGQKELIKLLEPSRRPYAERLLLEFNHKKMYNK